MLFQKDPISELFFKQFNIRKLFIIKKFWVILPEIVKYHRKTN